MKKLITKTQIKKYLPIRKKTSSKIDGGKVLIIGGGKGLYGAGILTSLAATRSGAGYIYLLSDIKKFNWLVFPDFIVESMTLKNLKKHENSVIAIGAGLGISKSKENILKYLIKAKHEKTIVDGDALTMLGKLYKDEEKVSLPESWILTPHEGEMARLLNVTSAQIKKNRLLFAKVAHEKYGCTIILKGAQTIIVTKNSIYLNNSGTPALAKAGSGDVLLGMICAFYAQTNNSIHASILGTYIHGYASKLWMDKKMDYLSMRPLDLIQEIPGAIFKLRSSRE